MRSFPQVVPQVRDDDRAEVGIMLSFRRWRPRHLLGAWIAYWVALFAVTLAPAVLAALRVVGDEQGHGSINGSFGDSVLRLTIVRGTTTMWEGSVHPLVLASWVAGPPLLLWLVWMARRERAGAPASVRGATP